MVIKMKQVRVGNCLLGSSHIYIQSMCNIETKKVDEVVKQINELASYGCEIVRLSVLDLEDAKAIKSIKEKTSIPLVADIHFHYQLALEAIKSGVDKLRINPANLKNKKHIQEIVLACKEKNIPIRIGVNAGGFIDKTDIIDKMLAYARLNISYLEELDFHDIVLSFKTSSLEDTIKINKIASKEFDYPLHIGVTEAGTLLSATVKNTIAIYELLKEGIGQTIRVSISDNPKKEVIVAKEILKALNLYKGPQLIACPTCGRTKYDMIPLAKKVSTYLETCQKDITVAVMGCVVNGPGEASNADIGVAGSGEDAIIFKKGKVTKRVKQSEIYQELIKEIEAF